MGVRCQDDEVDEDATKTYQRTGRQFAELTVPDTQRPSCSEVTWR